jgi:putative pyruvate formate lyase activating enzyme
MVPTNVDTHTYLFVDDVLQQTPQSTVAAGFPNSWRGTSPDYGLDDPSQFPLIAGDRNMPLEQARQAIAEMFRQVGDLQLDSQGLAVRGLLVRHLVMPGGLAEAEEIFDFLAGLSEQTYVNVMEQYRPCYKAWDYPPLDKALAHSDFERARQAARAKGLHRLDAGGMERLLARFLRGK